MKIISQEAQRIFLCNNESIFLLKDIYPLLHFKQEIFSLEGENNISNSNLFLKWSFFLSQWILRFQMMLHPFLNQAGLLGLLTEAKLTLGLVLHD